MELTHKELKDRQQKYKTIYGKDKKKKKRAQVCLTCKYNEAGFCINHNKWCSIANLLCKRSGNQ